MKTSTDWHTKGRIPEIGIKILGIVFWLILWQVAAQAVKNPLVLPSPLQTLGAMGKVFSENQALWDIGMTLFRVFGGVAVSFLLGIVLGVLCGLSKSMYCLLAPFVTVIRTVPVVSVIILMNLWLRSGWVPLMVTFLVCFPITWTNVVEGMQNTDKGLLEMAKVYNVGFFKRLYGIYFPSIRPYAFSALMNATGMGWKATVTAEVLANALPSIGMNLYYSKVYLETETLFAWTLIVIICSFVIEKLTVFCLKPKKQVT